MPIDVRMDARLGLVRIEASGELTLQDLLGGIAPMVSDPRFERDMPQLVDLGRVEHTELAAEQLQTLVESFAKESSRIGSSRVAVYAPKPLLFGVSRMFQSLAERLPVTFRVFRERATAEAWLREGQEPG
jgi:hypothetical protein